MIVLNILENHECHSCNFLTRNFLKDLAYSFYYSHSWNRNKLFERILDKRNHPDVQESIVYELNIISSSVNAFNQEATSTILQENLREFSMFVKMHKATHQSVVRYGLLLGSKLILYYFLI